MNKIKLNNDYHLIRCSAVDTDAMNGFTFNASENWVIKKDNRTQFATRYEYTTKIARDFKVYFWCGNPKSAIQQAILFKFPSEKLRDIYFIIKPITKTKRKNKKSLMKTF